MWDREPVIEAYEVDPSRVRDISGDVIGLDGRMLVLPAAYWATTTRVERALFGHNHGLYSFPTVELVAHLKTVIGDRKAIEIGAGHGVLADALGIVGTDNFQQARSPWREHYQKIGHPAVPYGPNVVELDALRAVNRYKPDVVIGCWVTHKYDHRRNSAGGNDIGVNEQLLLDKVPTYVVVGNEHIHKGKAIWDRPHEVGFPEWVYSRAQNGSRDFIAQWGS